jgi:ParG
MVKKEKSFSRVAVLMQPAPVTREGKKVRSTIYCGAETWRRFKALCENRGRSVSEVVEALMVDLVEQEEMGHSNPSASPSQRPKRKSTDAK